MKRWLGLLVAIMTGAAQPTLACSPMYSERVIVGPRPAARLVAGSTFVDIVVAESAVPISVADLEWGQAPSESDLAWSQSQLAGMAASTISFRVVERLKGHSPDLFTLEGSLGHFDPDLARETRELCGWFSRADCLDDRVYERFTPDELRNSCFQPLFVSLGQRYLVFRDADGSLTDPLIRVRIRATGEVHRVAGPVFEAIVEDDRWLDAVRYAVSTQP